MNEEGFCAKWLGELTGEWAGSAAQIYWARSYKMDKTLLLEMSKDFIEASPEDQSTAMDLARMVVDGNCVLVESRSDIEGKDIAVDDDIDTVFGNCKATISLKVPDLSEKE